MAAGLVDDVAGRLSVMVLDEISKEDSLFLNFRKDFQWLNKKLTHVSNYLKDADVQSVHNKSVKGWLLDVADIAWDAEDILQECAAELVHGNYGSSQSSCVLGCPFNYSQLFFRYKMARRIKDIRDRMRSVMEDAAELKLVSDLTLSKQPSTSTSQNVKWLRSSDLERDSRPVAIESKVKEILSLLDDPAALVIAIVGMGGAGKTFLLQNVFNRIQDRFDYSIWLSISQTYSVQRLQANLAAKINLADVVNGRISEVQAAEFIHSQLESKRSLIVLDDVWRATGEDDLIRTLGFPVGNNTQCKIVVTTRNKDVCRSMNARVYEMQLLSQEESWELFCAFAFSDCEQNRPPRDLKQIASEIEKECVRLPLAVKTVAASLTGKTSSRDWESKLREIREVSNKDDPIMEILKLSYDSLPAPLKPCFAYLSFFPEDERIDPEYLIYLWIVEGFIQGGEDQVEIGWSYINQLANLCLVETKEKEYLETIAWCKMHDLLLDLAISISKESRCAFSVAETFSKVQRSSVCRRILLGKQRINDNVIASNSGANSVSRLRTLSLSENAGIQNIPANFFAGMNVLRTLDLSRTDITTLPESVGNLKLLRVLNLCCTKIREVPDCVRIVTRLCFLDISRCTSVQQLPAWIGELECLEHLNVVGCSPELASCMPAGVSKLFSLRILRSDYLDFSTQESKFLKLEHVARMTQLQELTINVNHDMELKGIEEGVFDELVKMRSLAIANEIPPVGVADSLNLPLLPETMESMNELEKLYLWNFSVSDRVIHNFKKLRLIEIAGNCRDYPDLKNMPCLERLNLLHNNNATELPEGFGKAGGFPKLRFLEISDFPLLKEFPDLEEGAMPRLKKLCIHSCTRLKKIPEGLERLKSLREIEVHEGSKEIVESLHEGGQDWRKLKAIIPWLNISVNR